MSAELQQKVQQDPLWPALTEKQRNFVISFLELRDKVEAAKAAYGCTDYKKANTQANRTLRSAEVRKVLRNAGDKSLVDGGLVGRQEIMQLISNRIRNVETDAASFVKLVTMYGSMKKLKIEEGDKEEKPVDFRQLEMQRKANG